MAMDYFEELVDLFYKPRPSADSIILLSQKYGRLFLQNLSKALNYLLITKGVDEKGYLFPIIYKSLLRSEICLNYLPQNNQAREFYKAMNFQSKTERVHLLLVTS